MLDKVADLAGPGIGDYAELERILPQDYKSLLTPRETQRAIFAAKNYIEENLCKALNLMMVTVPLIVDVESGVNDYLDRDGSRAPIQFHVSNDHNKHPIDAQIVQAATKWKRVALKRFGMGPGEGLCTDMRAVRKDYCNHRASGGLVDDLAEQFRRNASGPVELVGRIIRKGVVAHLAPQVADIGDHHRGSAPVAGSTPGCAFGGRGASGGGRG